tara:strand:- start:4875 stop:5261 length:387 start_codon:yes stop_codon:yes gene_type:complete
MKKSTDEHFEILRTISNRPNASQRQMADELGFSLGKLNYCLKELQKKGLIKIKNFKKNPKKINYLYVLTPQGISSKTKLTINFMKRMMKEYDQLRLEISKNEFVNVDKTKEIKPNVNQQTKKIDKSLL